MNNLLYSINGVNIVYVFGIAKKVLAAYSGEVDSTDLEGYCEFSFKQLKYINDETDAGNSYFFLMNSGNMQGASAGIEANQAVLVFRDGKEAAFEVVKRFLYDQFLVVAPHLKSSTSKSTVSDFDFGFDDVTSDVSNILVANTFEESQFYLLNNIQLPPFNITAYATKQNGEGVIAKKEWIGIKVIGDGSGDEVSSVESNTIATCFVSEINDWHEFKSDLEVIK